MEAYLVVGILLPVIALICAMGFLFLWTFNRKLIYGPILAAAFVSEGVGTALNLFIEPYSPRLSSWVCGIFSIMAVAGLAFAIISRYKLPKPIGIISVTVVATTIANYFALYHTDNLTISFSTVAMACGIICLVLADHLRHVDNINPMDKAIAPTLAVIGLVLIADPLVGTLTHADGLPIEGFLYSSRWITMQMMIIVVLVLLAVCLFVVMIADIMQQIQAKADIDTLTGISRRGPFENGAVDVLAKVKRTPLPVSMIVCDIDNFKSINDQHGHLVGDQVIARVANVLKENTRETDLVARLGGEEFGILLWNADVKAARLLAEQLRTCISLSRADDPFADILCTASLGVAQFREGDDYKSIFGRADKALYEAKSLGRNRVESEETFLAAA